MAWPQGGSSVKTSIVSIEGERYLVAEGDPRDSVFIARIAGPDRKYGLKREWLGTSTKRVTVALTELKEGDYIHAGGEYYLVANGDLMPVTKKAVEEAVK